MGAALALGERGRGRTAPNPNVGCVIVRDGHVVGRGWTQAGGRPHAEAMALEQAGSQSRGATCHTTLEPCAHLSTRGPSCSDLLTQAGVARVVAALGDPDPRTNGQGVERLRAGGIAVEVGVRADEARRSMAGFLTRRALGRPHVTLKLATSLDGRIALSTGESRWITGPEARAHVHLERARHEAILVGRGTWEADAPKLDVRLPGLEDRSPRRVVLTSRPLGPSTRHPASSHDPAPIHSPASSRHPAPSRHPSVGWGLVGSEDGSYSQRDPSLRWDDGNVVSDGNVGSDGNVVSDGSVVGDGAGAWQTIPSPHAIADLAGVDHLLVEGGAATAAAFLRADLVDRLLLYRAPIILGAGLPAIGDIGLIDLSAAHGRWRLHDARQLGSDRLEVYERTPCSPA